MKEPKIIYKSHRILTLYFAALITFAMVGFAYYMIITRFDSLQMEFSSTTNFIAFLVFVFLCTHILLGAMLWLHQRYVLQVVQVDDEQVAIKTWSIVGLHGNKQYPKTILSEMVFNAGKGFYGRGPVVNAPWLKLTTPKGKTLVVDLQGAFMEDLDKIAHQSKIKKGNRNQ